MHQSFHPYPRFVVNPPAPILTKLTSKDIPTRGEEASWIQALGLSLLRGGKFFVLESFFPTDSVRNLWNIPTIGMEGELLAERDMEDL